MLFHGAWLVLKNFKTWLKQLYNEFGAALNDESSMIWLLQNRPERAALYLDINFFRKTRIQELLIANSNSVLLDKVIQIYVRYSNDGAIFSIVEDMSALLTKEQLLNIHVSNFIKGSR